MFLPNRLWLLPLAAALIGNGAPPVDDRCGDAAERARAPLAAADKALVRGDAKAANGLLDTGIAALGSRYHRAETIDDTGMRLTLARIAQGKGQLRTAAGLKRRVLSERLALCSAARGV